MGGYYVKARADGRTQGPFAQDQLKALAAKGKLKPDYLVSRDGHKWYIARNITDLPLPQTAADGAGAAAEAAVVVGTKRLPLALVTGLACGLLAVVLLTVSALHDGDDASKEDLGGGPSAVARKPSRAVRTSRPAADKLPATRARPPDPGGDKPTATPAPKKPPPPPKPSGKAEPPKPPGSFRVLSVKYDGQVVRAMGSQLSFILTNRSGKEIRAVQGSIRLYDPSGAYLAGLPLKITGPIETGAAVTKKGVWLDVGGLVLGMLDESSKKMTFKFAADRVTYQDGQTQTF